MCVFVCVGLSKRAERYKLYVHLPVSGCLQGNEWNVSKRKLCFSGVFV